MFETNLSLYFLQHYWWIIISLLAGVLVFLLFVQGGQTLIFSLGKTEIKKTLLINALGRKWEFTFTTLVVFGGAFFASFPLFYATSFGGAYWLWMSILLCFIIQAISYEYRSKPNNFLGKKVYEIFLFVNGTVGTILLGVAIGTFFTGSEFSINFNNITNEGVNVISQWQSPTHGLEALFNITNLLLGLTVFFLARVLGLLYFLNNIKDESLNLHSRQHLWYNSIPFLLSFSGFITSIFLSYGYAYLPGSGLIYMEKYKYFHNLLEMPLFGILFIIGVSLVTFGIFLSLFTKTIKGIWYSGTGTILTVFTLFINAGFNNTSFYPSTFDFQSSITIENSSSSLYSLTIMSYVSILIPFVIAYIAYAWRAINKNPINTNELKEEGHIY